MAPHINYIAIAIVPSWAEYKKDLWFDTVDEHVGETWDHYVDVVSILQD